MVIIELFVVSIGLIIRFKCLLILLISFLKYGIGFNVFLLCCKFIIFIFVVGNNCIMLFIILRLVCRIGIIVIFLFLMCFILRFELFYLVICMFFNGRFFVVLYVSKVFILDVSLWKFFVLIFCVCIRLSLCWINGWVIIWIDISRI